VRNARLAAIVFELAVFATGTTTLSGDLEPAFVVGLLLTALLGRFGLPAFFYPLLTV
jgi:hypothetical protein